MNVRTVKFKDNEEQRKAIRLMFCKAYNLYPENHNDGEIFDWDGEDTDDDIINIIGNTIIENIDDDKESANSLFQKVVFFTFHQLGKITFSNDNQIDTITAENMPRNFNEVELNNFKLIFDELIKFIQYLSVNSSLTEAETDDWDLDMINFSEVFFSSESIKFDKSVKGYDHLIGKANEIRITTNQ